MDHLRAFLRRLARESWLEYFEPVRDALLKRGVI